MKAFEKGADKPDGFSFIHIFPRRITDFNKYDSENASK